MLAEPALPQISGERTQGSQKTAVPCLEHSVQLTMPPIYRDGFTFSGGRRNQDETICQSVSSPLSGSSTLKHFPDLNPGHQMLNLPLRHTPEIGHPSPSSTTPSLKLGGRMRPFQTGNCKPRCLQGPEMGEAAWLGSTETKPGLCAQLCKEPLSAPKGCSNENVGPALSPRRQRCRYVFETFQF